MRRLFRSAALAIPFLLPAIAADAPAGVSSSQVLYTGKRQQPLPLSNVGDPANVAKARLFVTVDNGKTWTLAHELQIAEGTKDLPKFPFSAERDGAFGIMPCITYRNGQSEAEPKPGQAPPYVLVVDTAAPVIAQFDATLMGRAAAKAVVRLNWSVSDANPEKEPVAIEASTDGGARFITIHRGGNDGAIELTVPVTGETRDLHLRLVATDRARNVIVSPSRNLTLVPMPDPAAVDPKDALAKAVATLPTLDEVAITDGRPLPTTQIAPPSQDNPTAPVAPKATETTTPAAPATTTPPAPTAPARPDVVVDGKPYVSPEAGTPAPSAEKPPVVVADNSIDQAYYEALAATRPTPIAPNPKTAPRPVNRPQVAEAPPAAPARPAGDGQRPPASATPVIVDDEVKVLTDARVLAQTGNLDDACDFYERLRFSSLGKTALFEQVRLLIDNDRPRDAMTAVSSAPLEILTDPVRVDYGTLLLAAGRAGEVEAAVSGVAGDGPEARPALLLIAKAYAALGKTAESRRALEWLARGKDAAAAEARSLLGR
jgi:hypothetical protein